MPECRFRTVCPLALAIAHRAHLSAMWRMHFSLCRSLSVVVGVCSQFPVLAASVVTICEMRYAGHRHAISLSRIPLFIFQMLIKTKKNKNDEKKKCMSCDAALLWVPSTFRSLPTSYFWSATFQFCSKQEIKQICFMNLLCFN